MKLSIRWQLLILTISILVITVVFFAALSIFIIVKKGRADLDNYRKEEMQKVSSTLKDYIDMAYQSVESSYKSIDNKEYLEKFYGHRLKSIMDIAVSAIEKRAKMVRDKKLSLKEAQRLAIEDIEAMRFDNRTGYIWINDTLLPYPRMIMHPTVPDLNGKILEDPKFNCAMGINQNLFQAAVEVSSSPSHEGFVNYIWPKPSGNGLTTSVKKLSYVYRYTDWGWVMGTGIYLDDAQTDIIASILENLKTLKYNNGHGYFWVNDLTLPYPRMVMHPIVPSLDGQILDDPEFNTIKGTNENLYKAMVEKVKKTDKGYVEYTWLNPQTNKIEAKVSYVRKFAPLNWLIGSGIYIGHIQENIIQRENETNRQIRLVIFAIIGISIVLILGGYFATFYLSNNMVKTIVQVKDSLQSLSLGETIEKLQVKRRDEIGDMTKSLNNFVDGINSYSNFAEEIGKNNLDAGFTALSDKDTLGNSLIQMRNNLKQVATIEKERAWHNEGVTLINDVIRKYSHDLKELSIQFNRSVVNYLKANQSALYLLENERDGEPYLELYTCYAFDRQKHLTGRIAIGEGVIGQAVLEKNYIYLTDVPPNFVKITSGLGLANPTSIIIFPLVHNEEAQGVIEIASFEKFMPYEIDFLRKITEDIASVITTARVTKNTKMLLEETQQMAEEMKSQEEELRQNNEELQATQEELARKLREAESKNG
jgi:signal transduction histidine kinase/putative methionine-R-sulfoxide reductase with GAF domain